MDELNNKYGMSTLAPATMLTAIGLCVIIMLIQLVPEFQAMGSRNPTSVTASVR